MAIACKTLFEDAADQLGKGTGNERLAGRFVRAVNRSLDELSIVSDRATAFSHVSSNEDSISELSAKYEWIIYAGVIYNLIRMGQTPGDPRVASAVLADSRKQWDDAKDMYVMDLDNIIQSDETADVIGLGYVGDSTDT